MDRKRLFAIAGGLLLCMAGAASAQPATDTDVAKEMASMRARIAELESKQGDNWLTERRSDEIKGLVKEVLADSETRASMLDNDMSAGYNGKHFFLASTDGSFLMEIYGQINVRETLNWRQPNKTEPVSSMFGATLPGGVGNSALVVTPGVAYARVTTVGVGDTFESGFDIPRAHIGFMGHIGNPNILYNIRLNADTGTDSVAIDWATIGYEMTGKLGDLTVYAGEFTAPFLKEDINSPGGSLTANQSFVSEIFGLGKVQGIGATWLPIDMLKLDLSFNDGQRSGFAQSAATQGIEGALPGNPQGSSSKKFYGDNTDAAITARVGFKAMGNWDQFTNKFNSYSDDPMGLNFGAAVHAEVAETGGTGLGAFGPSVPNDKFVTWTLDANFQAKGFSVYEAVVGYHSDRERVKLAPPFADPLRYGAGNLKGDINWYGNVLQGAYNIADWIEPFVRHEFLVLDENTKNIYGNALFGGNFSARYVNIITAGVNVYNKRQNAKATADVMYCPNGMELTGFGADSTGLLHDSTYTNVFVGNGLVSTQTHTRMNQVVLRFQYQLLF